MTTITTSTTTTMVTKLSCQCQSVEISIPTIPIRRLECCCTDCRKGLQWCESMKQKQKQKQKISSPSSSTTTTTKASPEILPPFLTNDAVYFSNALRVEKGMAKNEKNNNDDHNNEFVVDSSEQSNEQNNNNNIDNNNSLSSLLACYLIKPGYNTRRIVATCCWTCLMGDHPNYQGKRFITYANSANLILKDGIPLQPIEKRIFEDDLDPKILDLLPPLETPPPLTPPLAPQIENSNDDDDDNNKNNNMNSGRTKIPTLEDIELSVQTAEQLVSTGEFITIQTLIDQLGDIQYMDFDFDGPMPVWNKVMMAKNNNKK